MRLISIMILWFNIAYGQCEEDIPRFCTYNKMEVFNSTTQQYEKYNRTDYTNLEVIIKSEDKIIKFKDEVNNYNKTFTIKSCSINAASMTYNCIDLDNERPCTLLFTGTDTTFELIVKYEMAPVIYKVSTLKQN